MTQIPRIRWTTHPIEADLVSLGIYLYLKATAITAITCLFKCVCICICLAHMLFWFSLTCHAGKMLQADSVIRAKETKLKGGRKYCITTLRITISYLALQRFFSFFFPLSRGVKTFDLVVVFHIATVSIWKFCVVCCNMREVIFACWTCQFACGFKRYFFFRYFSLLFFIFKLFSFFVVVIFIMSFCCVICWFVSVFSFCSCLLSLSIPI